MLRRGVRPALFGIVREVVDNMPIAGDSEFEHAVVGN